MPPCHPWLIYKWMGKTKSVFRNSEDQEITVVWRWGRVYWRNRISMESRARPWIVIDVYECFFLCNLTTDYNWFGDLWNCLKIHFVCNTQLLKLTSSKLIPLYLFIWNKLLTFLDSICFHLQLIFILHIICSWFYSIINIVMFL